MTDIGNRRTYPDQLGSGIIYREWLIGMIAGGISGHNDISLSGFPHNKEAIFCIQLADAIISKLNQEKK